MTGRSHPEQTAPQLETFGQRLRYCRKQAKLTQGYVASTLGLSQGSVTQYEQDKIEPTIDNLAALASLFEVTMEWLVRGGAILPDVPIKAPPKATPSRTGHPASSVVDSMLTPVQQATIDLLRTVAKAGLLPNAECLALMTAWQDRLDKMQQS